MGSCSGEILHDVPPYIRVYKDGTVERLVGTEVAPAASDPVTGVSSKDITIQPGLSARIYRPDTITSKAQKVPLVIYFHGGAFCISSAADPVYHNVLNILAAQAQSIMVSVDYRRAPEHPLPAAYEDSWDAVQWVLSNNSDVGPEEWLRDNVDFSKVFLAGDSAGANISHHLIIRATKSDPKMKFAGAIMIHPYFWGEKPIGLEVENPERKAMVDKWWRFVCPSDKGCDDPLINPFAGLEPGSGIEGLESCGRYLACIAGSDILSERGRVYCQTLVRSGLKEKVEILESKGEDHVFHIFNPNAENSLLLFKSCAAFINYQA